MPMPAPQTAWPPADYAAVLGDVETWHAWWTGDVTDLRKVYTNQGNARPSQYAGGVVGAASRFWWGRPNADLTLSAPRGLHIPLASDLCQASADLLYADPIKATVEGDQAADARLQEFLDDGLHAVLAEAAELSAALGTAYLRVVWDTVVQPRPFLTALSADEVVPVWRWGSLVEATVWREVAKDGQIVLRHLEHHFTVGRRGLVEHALFQGTHDDLGRRVPLTEHGSTAGIIVDADSVVDTGCDGLAITVLPNLRPQRRWRRNPLGRHLGRSDLDGVESELDALDEAWSSWMRDLRLGRGRLIVPGALTESAGPGRGSTFDLDQEVFVNGPAGSGLGGLDQGITPSQFEIRVEEHARTTAALTASIIQGAGYSPATLGVQTTEASGAMTATEVTDRLRRSMLTRDRKIRLQRPGVQDSLAKLLAVDGYLNGGLTVLPDVTVEWVDAVQPDPEVLARTAGLLRGAQAASTRTLVEMVHPDWDAKQVALEVAAVGRETALPVLADPVGAGEDDEAVAEEFGERR